MSSSGGSFSDEISAVRLRLLTPEEWAAILSGDPQEAARWVHAAARHGFKAAQVTWGQMLLDGRGVERDPASALHWFRRAADLGSLDGINMVGRCHELGWGVAVDHAEAIRWYRKAAAKGSDWGYYNLGSMLLYGEGIERNRAEALRCYMQAAQQGHVKAMGMVGRFHEEGWEVAPNPARAMHWYRRAAEGGDFWGQYHLARHLADRNPDAAVAWLRQAIEGGTHNFLRSVARMLLDHRLHTFQEIGVRALERCCESSEPADQFAYGLALAKRWRRDEALVWLRRAAERGHQGARRAVAILTGAEDQPARSVEERLSSLVRGVLSRLSRTARPRGDRER
jgi:TPR repeat protein